MKLTETTAALRAQVADLKTTNETAVPHVAGLIKQAALDQVQGKTANPFATAAALGKEAITVGSPKELANAAILQSAVQRLEESAQTYQGFLNKVERHFGKAEDVAITPKIGQEIAAGLNGPVGSFGGTFASRESHELWRALGATWAVNPDTHPDVLKPGVKSAAYVGRDGLDTTFEGISGRTLYVPISVLEENARTAENEAGKIPLRAALEGALRGQQAARNTVAFMALDPNGLASPTNPRFAAQMLQDPFQKGGIQASLLLSTDAERALRSVGKKLSDAVRAFDSNPPKNAEEMAAFWKSWPEAQRHANVEQLFFLQYDLGKQTDKKTGINAKKLEALSPDLQMQNVRSEVQAIIGALEANELMKSALSGKLELTQQLGEILQNHLDQVSQQAIRTANEQGDYPLASALHARAVADQELLQLMVFSQRFGVKLTQAQAEKAHDVLYRAAKTSSDNYGFGGPEGGAGGASKIGVGFAGELLEAIFSKDELAAMFPKEKHKDAQALATRLIGGSGYATIDAVLDRLGMPLEGTAQEHKNGIVAAHEKDWGIEELKRIPADGEVYQGKAALAFFAISQLLNDTWASQQASRAAEDIAAGKKGDRTDADARGGVYRSYLYMLLRQTPLEGRFRFAQDVMEAKKKTGTLLE
ncbi:MAG: hypothetical protein IT384_09650 [Deltaproteobacteria bacterium]|nr:hypothetical protein [Deltaproteobacteria bacterium]